MGETGFNLFFRVCEWLDKQKTVRVSKRIDCTQTKIELDESKKTMVTTIAIAIAIAIARCRPTLKKETARWLFLLLFT